MAWPQCEAAAWHTVDCWFISKVAAHANLPSFLHSFLPGMISSCFFDAVFVIFWGVRCPGPLFFAHGRGHSHSQRLNWIRFHAVRIPLARDGDQTDPRRLASERDPFQWAFWEACDHRWTTIWSPLRHRRPGATSPALRKRMGMCRSRWFPNRPLDVLGSRVIDS